MAKRMLIDAAHPEETRVVVLNGNRLEEFDFETSTKKQIKGNIYLAKVTRVEPSLQAAFVEYGGNRHGFLAFNEIHPDYYRIPIADRRAAEERLARAHERAYESPRGEAGEGLGEIGPEGEFHPEYADGETGETERPESGREPAMAAESGFADTLYDQEPGDAGDEDREAAESSENGADAPFGDADQGRGPSSDDEISEPQDASPWSSGAEPESWHSSPAPRAEPLTGEGETAPLGTMNAAPATPEGGDGAEILEPEFRGEPESVVGEETREAAAEAIETLGGDEIEEAPRQRIRPFRHYKIQEVIKRRQIMLVQVTKEERGNKGAALTTFLSLAGRYCVLMPNTPRGGGVSRKITNATDRRRLKELMSDLDVPEGMGVIVRTAGSERSKAEIKRDFEYLLRLWDDIRELTLKSTAPALIYEEGNLIKRSIRDLYTRDIEEVIIDGEEGYRTAKSFMKMLMPSHAKRIKPYRDPSVPLFHRFQVEGQIDAIHSPVVQLRSGGYIVINPTEALVAIDVNSGRSTKERNIEETALKTNIEAAEEIARQLRLRDLAGLIVIDFIDMEEHRHQAAVERKLKDAMRFDRARIQIGRISPFGLLELSRQRLRPSLLEASTQPCPHCNGTGHIRSTESTALHVLRAIEEEGMRRRSAEVSVAVPTAVALYILNHKRDALVQVEARYGLHVMIGNDDTLIPPAFRLERLRALTPAEIAALPVLVPAPIEEIDEEDEDLIDEDEEESAEAADEAEAPQAERGEEEGAGRRRRRRRRRGRRGEEERESAFPAPEEAPALVAAPETAAFADLEAAGEEETSEGEAETEEGELETHEGAEQQAEGESEGARKRRRRGRRGGRRRRRPDQGPAGTPDAEEQPAIAGQEAAPVAEQVEYEAPTPTAPEERVAEMEEAFHETPSTSVIEGGTEAVPVADIGDQAELTEAPVPAEAQPEAAEAETTPAPAAPEEPAQAEAEPPRHVASAEVPTHEVTGPPSNPKRGWWRRVTGS